MTLRKAEVYEKYAGELIRFATVLVGPTKAEDVVAEAVTRAFSAAAWPSVSQPRAYLFRATLNQARQTMRAERRRFRREQISAAPALEGRPDVRVEILQAIRRLSARQRAVVFFTYWCDLDSGEVGELMAISARTVQRELITARRRLEVLLK